MASNPTGSFRPHGDDDAVSIEDQVRIAHGLVESWRVRHIAVSNHSPERTRE